MSLIQFIMKDLEKEIPLDPKHKKQFLIGNYIGNSECHIKLYFLYIGF